jgi:hypothetical protein
MWSRRFWKQAAERCVKTAAQALVGVVGLDAANALAVDWKVAGAVAAGAVVLSLLTSLASLAIGPGDSPSLV